MSLAWTGSITTALHWALQSIPPWREVLWRAPGSCCFRGDMGAQQGISRCPDCGLGILSAAAASGYHYTEDTGQVLLLTLIMNRVSISLEYCLPIIWGYLSCLTASTHEVSTSICQGRAPNPLQQGTKPRGGTGSDLLLPCPSGCAGNYPSPPRIYLQTKQRKKLPTTINFRFSPWTLSNCLNWVWGVKYFPQAHISGIISKALSFGPLICNVIWWHFLAIVKVIYSHENIVPG